jgi:Uma2 family endonuclease
MPIMADAIIFEEQIEIPMSLRSLADFRAWAATGAFPERGRIDYLAGRIEVDMSPEDLHTHGILKTEIVMVVARRVKELRLGEIYSDRGRVSNVQADLSVEPDVVVVSNEALNAGRVRLVPRVSGREDRYLEMEGSPELVVEIVSDSSVAKDTQRLPQAYFAAGVAEFWLVDARGADLFFRIHRRGQTAYEPADSDPQGYQHSAVLAAWYRLDRSRNEFGRICFDLRERR